VHRSVSSALILLKTVDNKFPLLAFGFQCIKHVPRRCRHELTRMFHTYSIYFLSCHTLRLLCKIPRFTKCLNPGHTPLKIALSPLLFQLEITQNGVILKKRNIKKQSTQCYVRSRSGPALFESQRRKTPGNSRKAEDARQAHTERRRSLVANFIGTANPVSAAVDILVAVSSDAAAVSPINVEATREQARCADVGLSATASAFSGALTGTLCGHSRVTTDSVRVKALAILSGHRAVAEKIAATRVSDSSRTRQTPSGSILLYVWTFCRRARRRDLLLPHYHGPQGSRVWLFFDLGAS